MIELGGSQRFAFKALLRSGMHMRQQNFDRDSPPETGIHCPINSSSRTFPNQFFDQITVIQFLTYHVASSLVGKKIRLLKMLCLNYYSLAKKCTETKELCQSSKGVLIPCPNRPHCVATR